MSGFSTSVGLAEFLKQSSDIHRWDPSKNWHSWGGINVGGGLSTQIIYTTSCHPPKKVSFTRNGLIILVKKKSDLTANRFFLSSRFFFCWSFFPTLFFPPFLLAVYFRGKGRYTMVFCSSPGFGGSDKGAREMVIFFFWLALYKQLLVYKQNPWKNGRKICEFQGTCDIVRCFSPTSRCLDGKISIPKGFLTCCKFTVLVCFYCCFHLISHCVHPARERFLQLQFSPANFTSKWELVKLPKGGNPW